LLSVQLRNHIHLWLAALFGSIGVVASVDYYPQLLLRKRRLLAFILCEESQIAYVAGGLALEIGGVLA
jgi:hypothetical protein